MTRFGAVAELAEAMAGTASRLKKRAAIAAAIVAVRTTCEPTSIETPIEMGHPDDLVLFCLYLAGAAVCGGRCAQAECGAGRC